PSRVLDIGSSGDVIKLLDNTQDLSGKYASLSHRWGPSTATATTIFKSTQARTSGVPLSYLPKKIRDAIIITRYLGIRYLWVDSLCTIQDDRSDWALELTQMSAIYSGAFVVIAANHATDAEEGCFNTRGSRPSSLIDLPEMGQPLSQRGWAFQERVLARRIIHYNTRQMYFECNHGIIAEDGRRFEHRWQDLSQVEEGTDSSQLIEIWEGLVYAYCERKFTNATDKLPAISGLARLLGARLGAQYVAGLWSDILIRGLTWHSFGERKAASIGEYTGPSWSWASYGGTASY
ncbi:heterokaryon incompatibility protein-domain-containing protein, partial [Mariannaea sp. PMI_226]